MLKAYKYYVHPTHEQKTTLGQYFGAARWIFNWALEKKIKVYKETKEGEKPQILSAKFEIAREIPILKKTQATSWLKNAPSMSLIYELEFLDLAYKNFFRRVKTGENPGFPKFKSKYSRQSFTNKLTSIDFDKNQVKIPKLGWIDAKLHRRFTGQTKSFTLSKEPTGEYFISILVEDGLPYPDLVEPEKIVGIDKGTYNVITTSDGEEVKNPKYFEKYKGKLAKLQNKLSKKVQGSKKYELARIRVARMHAHISDSRSNFIHNLTTKMIKSGYDTFVTEGFNASKLAEKNSIPGGAKRINDTGWGIFQTQLEYKAKETGKNVLKLDKYIKINNLCLNCTRPNDQWKFWHKNPVCKYCNYTAEKNIDAAEIIKNSVIIKSSIDKKATISLNLLVSVLNQEFLQLYLP